MSISPNVGALASFLRRKMTSGRFVRFRAETKNVLGAIPRFGASFLGIAQRAEGWKIIFQYRREQIDGKEKKAVCKGTPKQWRWRALCHE